VDESVSAITNHVFACSLIEAPNARGTFYFGY
jgi:hypothetical protein